jgi:hypothetical protein
MKGTVVFIVSVIGMVLLAGGNDWGMVGIFPALWYLLKEDFREVDTKKGGSPRF